MPEYTGTGKLVLEPTYKYIILIDVSNWNDSIVIEDGLFLASESQLKHKIAQRANFSSAALGGEGFFNLGDRKSTRLNSSHLAISYAVFCLKKTTIARIKANSTHEK